MLKKFEKNVYNWSNRTVQEFAEAIARSQVCETKAIVNVTPALNVNLTTTANKTIFNLGVFTGSSYPNININLSNPGEQSVGDELILIANPNSTSGNINICFNAADFYLTKGSNTSTCLSFDDNKQERLACTFIYDGQKFVNSADNY